MSLLLGASAALSLAACGGEPLSPETDSSADALSLPAWIYHDSLVSPWTDGSWGTHSLTNTSPRFAGTRSISVKMAPWQALVFGHAGFSLSGRSAFSLQVNGAAGSTGAALRVRALVNGAWTVGTALGPTCAGGAVKAGAWTRCDVPLAAIAPAGATIKGIALQEDKGKALPTLYFDEVGFDVSAAAVAVSVTLSPSTATVAAGQSAAFTATVSGAAGTVTWSVPEGAAGGTVSSTGVYTAPATQGTYHVVARSQADPTKSATATVTVTANAPPPAASTWVSGYYVAYQSSMYAPSQVDFSAITHLIVGGVTPNADGTLDTSFFIDPVSGPALAKDLSSRAHAAGRKAILMVGGSGALAGWEGAASAGNRAKLVQNLLTTMQSLGFDGLDLDWEPVPDADKPLLLALAKDLRAASPGMLLTIPVTWVSAYGGADGWYAQLAPSFDQINIMSYQMADTWPGWLSWHSGALAGESASYPSSVSSSANAYALVGIPKSKIGIGIGFYGSCWRGVTDPRQSLANGAVVAGDNVMTYAHIMASYHSAAAYHWDAAASAGSLSFAQQHGPEGCNWVSYEDDASITAKGQWVRANGFGGTILWSINQGYVASTGTNPPLESVKKAFLQ